MELLKTTLVPIISDILDPKRQPSTLGFKYPKLRDFPVHSSQLWLKGKQYDDGAEGLWRIHDGIYDLSDFIHHHPGGSSWIELTKGTDITELFESHHISSVPETMLSTFFIRKTTSPRNSPFTFHENGFYRTLKKSIREVLKDVPQWPATRSKIITDFYLASFLIFTLAATYWSSYILGAIAGFFIMCTSNSAHNFMHKKTNFRTYYFDLTFMHSRSWMVSHIISHHMYPNTIQDLEISNLEPFFQWFPQKKLFFFRYLSWFYSPIIYSVMFLGHWISETTGYFSTGKGFSTIQLLPFVIPILAFFITGQSLLWTIIMYIWIMTMGSFIFAFVGLNAAHHHPDLFHEGDTPRPKEELDWGVHQLDAVGERPGVSGSPFLVLMIYGDHSLHHLFPTIDHGHLDYLYPVLLKTCDDFGVDLRTSSQFDLVCGQFRQLVKTRPKLEPPKPLRKKQISN